MLIRPPPVRLSPSPTLKVRESSVPNPFVNSTWYLTLYERVKVSVLAVTVLPIRLGLLIVVLPLLSLWCRLWLLCLNPSSRSSAAPWAWPLSGRCARGAGRRPAVTFYSAAARSSATT